MNHVIISGRFARDPEIRYTNTNKAVCSFTLAVDDGKDKDGKKKAQFLDCTAWEKTAEIIDQYFTKGDGITVTGKLQKRTWEKDGQKHSTQDVVVSGIEFPLARKNNEEKVNAFSEIEDTGGELPF